MPIEPLGPGPARLALRGAAGRLWSDLHRPAAAGTPLLVFFPDPARPLVEPAALCRDGGLAVLVSRAAALEDAVAVVQWAAEHAGELDADPARLLVGGERAGAALAAGVARRAYDEGWPPLLRQVLVRPGPGVAPAPGAAPPTVVAGAAGLAVRLGALPLPPGPAPRSRTTPIPTRHHQEDTPMRRISMLPLLTVAAVAAASGCASGAAAAPAPAAAEPGRYATVNGLQMYYEVHGPETGRPLVLIHGALSGIGADFGELLPVLARDRRVIAVEQQAHGHTADIDRPLRVEHMVDDTVALLGQLGVAQADVLGYSMGASVALGLGLQRPDLVHKLVLVTPTYDTDGMHAGLLEGLQDVRPEMLHGSPFHEYYLDSAPRPEDFPTLVEKNKDMQLNYPDHPASAVEGLAAPVLLVAGDSDIVRLDHMTEFFGLLGGGVVGDQVGLPESQLAVLPATTHLGVIHRPELHTIVPAFLGAPA